MNYIQKKNFIHILSQPLDRKKFELEFILTSGGSWFESPEDRGKKHLMEHCIASRTKNLNFQQLKDFEYSENLMLNAYTQPITMGLTVGGHCSDFEKMVDLLLEMAFEPTFDQEILDREREIVLREVSERRGDPSYRLHFETMGQVFTSDSYSNHEVLGNIEMVEKATIEDFYKLHKQNLEKSHAMFLLSGGNINLDYFQQKLDYYLDKSEYFSGEQSKTPVNFQVDNTFKDFSVLPIVSELAHSHAEISIFLPCEINYKNKPALQVFENLFLKYGGILYDRLRDELGLVYGIQNNFDTNLQVLDIYLSCEIQYINTILDEIKKVFSDFSSLFNPQKFDQFKNIIRKKLDISQDTLGASTAFTQGMLRTYGVPEKYDDYADRLLAVTKDEVEQVYNYIRGSFDKMRVVIVSNDEDIKNIKI
jgi:predicted Zn-dependent peptidase